MTSIAVTVDDALTQELQQRLNHFARLAGQIPGLYERLTALGESQTRRRIETEKTSPEGLLWADWSPDYAKTRHSGQSLLINEGNLLDSLAAFVEVAQAGWGSPLDYAIEMQEGVPARHVPARPFLGISDANLDELAAALDQWALEQLNG
jgi:phage gpG-like protein